MKIQNTLANRIDTAGDMISYDEACKKVLANKMILAWILKTCTKEFREYCVEDIAEKYIEGEPEISKSAVHADETAEFVGGMNTEDATMKEGTVTFDIKFRAVIPDTDETVDMIVNLETQNDFYPGYPIIKRGIYYASRMISSQYGTVFSDSQYQKIKKVCSIWICPHPPGYRKNTIVSYSMRENNIAGVTEEKESNYDLISVVIICLGGKDREGYTGLLKMLDVLLSGDAEPMEKKKTLQDEFGIAMTKEMEGGMQAMCNLSQGVYDDAVMNNIKNLMESMEWDIEKCMDALKIPEGRKELYRNLILEETVLA